MGSPLCSQEWVANRLNVTTRTVRSLVKRGLLKQHIENGHPMYESDEVEQIAIERGTDYQAMNRKSFMSMQRRLTQLEQDMAVVRRAMDISSNPLRLSHQEAAAFYKEAVSSLGAGSWSVEEIKLWADYFDRLDEAALAIISAAVVVDNPWEVFFRLCVSQMIMVSSDQKFKTTLELQEIHKKLDEGRKKLRGTILMWMEMQRGDPVKVAMDKLESGLEDVKKRLTGNSRS